MKMQLLAEEVEEIESIYSSIEAKLDTITVPGLDRLIDAIRSETERNIENLTWIKMQIISRCIDLWKKLGPKAFKIVYTNAARSIYMNRYRAIILSMLVNLVTLYAYLSNVERYRIPLVAIGRVVNSAKALVDKAKNLNFHVFVEHEYSANYILLNHGVAVLCAPAYDLFKPWKWTLLLHEIGHIVFSLEENIFIEKFRSLVFPLLKQLAPRGEKDEDARSFARQWEVSWLAELVSDLYGVALGGPAYTWAFMIEVFDSNPSEPAPTHPPLDARIYVQLRYLEQYVGKLDATQNVKKLWKNHRQNILAEELRYPFIPRILDEIIAIFNDVVRNPPFTNYYDTISKIRNIIEEDKPLNGDPLHLILALTISNKRGRVDTQMKVIKTIAEAQYH